MMRKFTIESRESLKQRVDSREEKKIHRGASGTDSCGEDRGKQWYL